MEEIRAEKKSAFAFPITAKHPDHPGEYRTYPVSLFRIFKRILTPLFMVGGVAFTFMFFRFVSNDSFSDVEMVSRLTQGTLLVAGIFLLAIVPVNLLLLRQVEVNDEYRIVGWKKNLRWLLNIMPLFYMFVAMMGKSPVAIVDNMKRLVGLLVDAVSGSPEALLRGIPPLNDFGSLIVWLVWLAFLGVPYILTYRGPYMVRPALQGRKFDGRQKIVAYIYPAFA